MLVLARVESNPQTAHVSVTSTGEVGRKKKGSWKTSVVACLEKGRNNRRNRSHRNWVGAMGKKIKPKTFSARETGTMDRR